MSPRRVLNWILLSLLWVGPVLAQSSPDPEETAIRSTVERYFNGLMTFEEAPLREAFHPDAQIMTFFRSLPGAPPNVYYNRSFESWLVFTRGTPPSDPDAYSNQIESIDRTGDAAVVKTILDWPSVRYVDYLSLLKMNGTWRIVNKIWHEERK